MNVLLLCDKTKAELFPLMGELPSAQLPLLGKTIAEYHVELVCAQVKPTQITVLGGDYQHSLQSLLGDGARWGIELRYQKSLSLQQALPLLVVPCDRLSSVDLAMFLQQAQQQPEQSAVGMANGIPVAYWVAQPQTWREIVSGAPHLPDIHIDLPASHSLPIHSIRAFYDANLGLLKNQFPLLSLGAYEENESLLLASRAEVSPTARQNGRAYIGAASRIGDGTSMVGHSVIGQQVWVDGNALLENCVILPHSYVGSWVAVRNAVVSGSHVWRMDTGVAFRVNERFLLSQLPVSGGENWFSRWLGRGRKTLQESALNPPRVEMKVSA